MNVQKLVLKMYQAIIDNDNEAEKELWLKSLRKSLKSKKTHIIK